MPHLAPLSWALAPLTFWLLILMTLSILWWTQPAKFPKLTSTSRLKSPSTWKWY